MQALLIIILIALTVYFFISKAVEAEVYLEDSTKEEELILSNIDSCKTPEHAKSCQTMIFNFKDKSKGDRVVADKADALMFYLDQKYITLN